MSVMVAYTALTVLISHSVFKKKKKKIISETTDFNKRMPTMELEVGQSNKPMLQSRDTISKLPEPNSVA